MYVSYSIPSTPIRIEMTFLKRVGFSSGPKADMIKGTVQKSYLETKVPGEV